MSVLLVIGFALVGPYDALYRSGNMEVASKPHQPNDTTQQKSVVAGNRIVPEMPALLVSSPVDAGFPEVDRPLDSRPEEVWKLWLNHSGDGGANLPTNAWWENIVLGSPTQEGPANKLVALPYTLDVAGRIGGLRIHFPRVAANDRAVLTEFDWRHSLEIGSIEKLTRHYVDIPGTLSIDLVWYRPNGTDILSQGWSMRSPVVRGSPYVTMQYAGVKPYMMSHQELTGIYADGKKVRCSSVGSMFLARRELEIVFSGEYSSDYTWLVFLSEPMKLKCTSDFVQEKVDGPTPGSPKVWRSMPLFQLEAVEAPEKCVIRAALANNCTSGVNLANCEGTTEGRNQTAYSNILRKHANVYPNGESRVGYKFSHVEFGMGCDGDETKEEFNCSESRLNADPDVGHLYFIYGISRMDGRPIDSTVDGNELIMFSLPHHRESLLLNSSTPINGSDTPTLHGLAKLLKGDRWEMELNLPPLSHGIDDSRVQHTEMLDDLHSALDVDVKFNIPANYLIGAGDTYFSGKLLAKLGRIALIAEVLGRHDDAMAAAGRLVEALDVWTNGTAEAPLMYDPAWGGIVSCGCEYKDGHCINDVGDCPGLSDVGNNFGNAFYNDHHFHYGYHIYAASIAAQFYPEWGMKTFTWYMSLVRDIANPSPSDTYFPMFRHKDWYLGSSWALGIATLGGVPYMNGRNQESSSEAVNAYHGVALYGQIMSKIFASRGLLANAEVARLAQDTGRVLMSTELRSAKTYWHVLPPGVSDYERIYPLAYKPFVVGMIWQELVQSQTWFGAEPWKVMGIQMLPITGASEDLLDPTWMEQALPSFEESCEIDRECRTTGWSQLVSIGKAIVGKWREGWKEVQSLPPSSFDGPGGDGHSRSNSLYAIASYWTDSSSLTDELT